MIQGHQSAGHPVDIASGMVWTQHKDFTLNGRVPMGWERRYSTGMLASPAGPLGRGWTCPYFVQLTRIGKDWHFRTAEGALVIFPDPDDSVEKGGVIRSPGSFLEIAKPGFQVKVTRWGPGTGEFTRYAFNPDRNGVFWPLRSIEDPTGQGLDLAWDDKGRLKGIRQRLEKRTLTVESTSDGKIASVAFMHADGTRKILVRYEYDRKGMLGAAFDALGLADRFEYDDKGLLIREMAKDGGIFTFKYDDKGRCIRTAGLNGYDLKVIRYLDHIGWTEVTNSHGHVSRYQWLPTGQVILQIDPLGGMTKTAYDEHGRIASEEDPMGGVTLYEYDDRGNRAKVTDALGQETAFEFTDWHQTLSMTDAGGNAWVREYDATRRLAKSVNPLDGKWEVGYDPVGNPVKVENPAGAVQLRVFSALGALQEATDWAGNWTRYRHDEFGNTLEKTGPTGAVTRAKYDALFRVESVQYPDGTTKSLQYDAGGNVIRFTGRNGESTTFRYGPCKRLLERRDRAGNLLRYEWGTEPGELLSITNRNGEVHRFWRDSAGRVVREQGFDGREIRYRYDLAGRLIEITRPGGDLIALNRDAIGRIVERVYPDGSATFAYDHANRLMEAANAEITLKYVRDPMGRILEEEQGSHRLERVYDPMGRVLELKSSLGADIRNEYDGNGSLSAFEINGNGKVDFARNALGFPVSQKLPSGLALEQRWDDLGRLMEQSFGAERSLASGGAAAGPLEAILTRQYRYGPQGEVAGISDSRWGKVIYAYDRMERLLKAAWEGGLTESFQYDPEGNVLAKYDSELGESTAEYAPGGQLTRFGAFAYAYDAQGRLITKSSPALKAPWEFAWSASDRLISLVTPAGESWTYGYDPMGRRIRKEGPGTKSGFVWDGDLVLHEVVDGKAASTFAYETDHKKPLAMVHGGAVHYILTDSIGTPRDMVDAQGKVVWSARYRAYGMLAERFGSGVECPLRFKGQWHDPESGLHYNMHRYFDPETGRYISPDPIRLLGGLNSYAYTPNPVNYVDPMGLAVPFQIGTYGELTNKDDRGDKLDAHELIRNKYLEENGLAPEGKRNKDNPSIALPMDVHDDVHRHENDIRREMGLGPNDMTGNLDTELAITTEALRRAGVPEDKIAELEEKARSFADEKGCS